VKYRTILADPPWNETGGGKIRRGADAHYSLMKTDDIIQLMKEVLDGNIDENAHLYLWVTNNHLIDGLRVIDALGFRYVTTITWLKDRFGLGQYFRGNTEHCLFAVKGVLPYKVIDGKRAQGVTGFVEKRTEHSRKPEQLFVMAERVSYAPRIELFARRRREGWDLFGDEVYE